MLAFSILRLKYVCSVFFIASVILLNGALLKDVQAQCTSNTIGNDSPQNAKNTGETQTWDQNAKSYVKINGISSNSIYTISSSNTTDYITIRTSNTGGTVINKGTTPLTFSTTATTIYVINSKNSSCATNGAMREITMAIAPVISNISASACVGGTFTVTGTGLAGVTSVSINGENAPTFTINSSTSITVTVPTGATTGKVSVTGHGGTNTSSSSITIGSSIEDNSGDDQSVCSGTLVTLGAASTSGRSYKWSPATGLSSSTKSNPTATPTVTTTYTLTETVISTGCSVSNSVVITIKASPGDNAGSDKSYCGSGQVTIGKNPSMSSNYSWSPSTGLSNASIANPTASPNATTTYTLTETFKSTGCSSANSVVVTVSSPPTVSITPSYCTGGGNVQLTSTSYSSYLWSTGSINQSITVDRAGTYSVTATNSGGCTGTASYSLAIELVVNGDFSSGNTGFTSGYNYTDAKDGLQPEDMYAVGNDANYFHDNFWGFDHTDGDGKFMIVNGNTSATPKTVWQQTVTIVPNTVYYFSAYAISMNNVTPYAQLRFAVDGVQIGTTANLTKGATSNSGPFNWKRFYGTWNSGSKSTAVLSIVDLQTAAGGNDFALDDISCSTLSTVALDAIPSYDPVCEGGTLKLYSNTTGGMQPMTYKWAGPNSFSATTQDATISGATTSMNGTYSVTITDAHGCSTSANTTPVSIIAAPSDKTVTAVLSVICTGNSTNIKVAASSNGVSYQLRNNADNAAIGSPVSGTGGNINLPTGSLPAGITTFNVLATSNSTGCTLQMSNTPSVTVSTTPVIVTQPNDVGICGGGTASFNISVSGSDVNYQWKERQGASGGFSNITNGTSGNGAVYSGANSNSLSISNTQTGMNGWSYYCVITNSCSTSVSSGTVSLSASVPGQWNGTSSINWNDAANWCNGIPDKTTDVVIPSGTPYQPTVNSNAECHNLTIQSGATVKVISTGTLDLYGDLVANGTFENNSGLLQLKGSTIQNLPEVNAFDVVIDNQQGVSLGGTLTVTHVLTFSKGKIFTGDYSVEVTNKAVAAITGFARDKYIAGTLKRAVNSTGNYEFPVGSPTFFQLAVLDLKVLIGVNDITAKFTNSALTIPVNTTIIKNSKVIRNILDCGYWTIEANQQPIAGTYTVSLFPLGSTNSKVNDDFIVIKKPSGSAVSNFTAPGTYFPPMLNDLGDRGAKMAGLTSFSDYGVGSGEGDVLPIKLTYFTAEKTDNNDDVLLKWNTAAELNNDHFELEVATEMLVDGRLDFNKFGEVPGAGTTTIPHDYNFTDEEPGKTGMRYYRLKQVDYDGTSTYSDIQPLSFSDKVELSELYPNPVTNILHFTIKSTAAKDVTISIYNLTGQEVYRNNVQLTEGRNMMSFDMIQLPRGYYIFNVTGDSDVKIKEKFEKF